MPTIKLKPNSPEYDDTQGAAAKTLLCDHPGCTAEAVHRAPKHRGLNEFYNFCFEHARAYNRNWNFFEGMADSEVQDHMQKARYGDRPTWRYDGDGDAEEILRNKAWQEQHFTNQDSPNYKQKQQQKRGAAHGLDPNSKEFEALAVFGLAPPLDLDAIKKRYKELALKYHPDHNGGCKQAEERLKHINAAYTALRSAFERYDILENKS